MTNPATPSGTHLRALYAQIEDICRHFKEIRSEAAGIVTTSQMPDATLHLNDVLQSTEEAITTVLDATTAISYAADSSCAEPEIKQKIAEETGRIYEACSFQDISGQRIKKVLQHLSELETQLLRLSDTAKGEFSPVKQKDTLLNGPQLSAEAPSQADIDQLFSQLK